MATMVEFAQRILTKRPTVARTSESPIWLPASSPTRARDPRTEITRPKDVTSLHLSIAPKGSLCRRWLDKRLSRTHSELLKSAASRSKLRSSGIMQRLASAGLTRTQLFRARPLLLPAGGLTLGLRNPQPA